MVQMLQICVLCGDLPHVVPCPARWARGSFDDVIRLTSDVSPSESVAETKKDLQEAPLEREHETSIGGCQPIVFPRYSIMKWNVNNALRVS